MPADHGNSLRARLREGGLLIGGVDATQDDRAGPFAQGRPDRLALGLHVRLAVEDLKRPADCRRRLLNGSGYGGNALVGDIGGHEDDRGARLRARPA
jgi:hypothetical protein